MVRCRAYMFVLMLVSLSEAHLETLQSFKCFKFFSWGEGCDVDGIIWDCDFFLSHGTSFTLLLSSFSPSLSLLPWKERHKDLYFEVKPRIPIFLQEVWVYVLWVAMNSNLSYIQVSNVCTALDFLVSFCAIQNFLSIELKLRRQRNDLTVIFKYLFYCYY